MEMKEEKKLPIIFIHGMWKGSWVFQDWVEFIRSGDGREVYTPSLRGYDTEGKKPFYTGWVSFYSYVKDIQNFLSENNIEECDIVGYSGGGLIAQYLLGMDKRIRSATFVASLPPKGVPIKGAAICQLTWKFFHRMLFWKKIPFLWEEGGSVGTLFPASGRAFFQIWKGISVNNPKKPSLAVVTMGDMVISAETQMEIAKKLDSEIQAVRKGHQVVFEDHDKSIILSVLNWIDGLSLTNE